MFMNHLLIVVVVPRTLEQNHLQLPLITVQWFMCIFVNTLRPEVTLRVWDMFLNEGSKVLFRIGAALFKMNEDKLCAVRDAGDLFNVLRNIGKDIADPDALIAVAYKSYTPPTASGMRAMMRSVLQTSRRRSQFSLSSPVTAEKLRMATTSNISPRLHSMTPNGAVPKDLLGLGLAHLGPADAEEKYRAHSKSVDMLVAVQRAQWVALQSENEAAIRKEEEEAAATPTTILTSQALETRANDLTQPVVGSSTSDESLSMSTPPSPSPGPRVTDSASNGDVAVPLSPSSDRVETMSMYSISNDAGEFDSSFADPSLLFNNISDLSGLATSRGLTGFVANNNSDAHRKKMERRKRKARNGELAFFRTDIALWRSSFRPGLEERFHKMEAARSSWRQKSTLPSVLAIAASNALEYDGESMNPTPVCDGEEQGDYLSSKNRKAVTIDRAESTSATRRLSHSFKDILRRSRSSSISSQSRDVSDTSDLKYNIDHEFVNNKTTDDALSP
jgi:hypothetical protein